MGVGKQESLAEVGPWCRQTEGRGEWGGRSCVVWEGFLVEGALGPGWPTSEGSGRGGDESQAQSSGGPGNKL